MQSLSRISVLAPREIQTLVDRPFPARSNRLNVRRPIPTGRLREIKELPQKQHFRNSLVGREYRSSDWILREPRIASCRRWTRNHLACDFHLSMAPMMSKNSARSSSDRLRKRLIILALLTSRLPGPVLGKSKN